MVTIVKISSEVLVWLRHTRQSFGRNLSPYVNHWLLRLQRGDYQSFVTEQDKVSTPIPARIERVRRGKLRGVCVRACEDAV